MGIFKRNNFNSHASIDHTKSVRSGAKRKASIILVLIGISLIGLFIIRTPANKDGVNTKLKHFSDNFVSTIIRGDTAASYGMLSQETKQSLDQAQWETNLKPLQGFYNSSFTLKDSQELPTQTSANKGDTLLTYQTMGKDNSEHLFRVDILTLLDGSFVVNKFSAVSGTYYETP